MDGYDLLKKRIMTRGTNVEHRIANDKLKTLEKALIYSYQAETIMKQGEEEELRALINNNKLKMDYDDKLISIPFKSGFKVGTVFYWPRIGEHWIVYLRQYSEDAYFRGYIRKAQHKLRWEDEFGVLHETLGAVRGPVETKIRSEQKSGNSFDVPNYTLSIIVPHTEATSKLKRYSKIAVSGKIWEVAVADDINEPGVIELQLLEYYINKETDIPKLTGVVPLATSEIEGVKVRTSLDGVKEMELYEPFKLWSLVERDGVTSKELTENAKFSVVSGSAVVTDNFLNVLEPPGLITIKLEIPKLNYSKEFSFEAKALSLPPASQYLIEGDENVKSYGKAVYTAKYYLDGVEADIEMGQWSVAQNDKLFSISRIDKDFIEFKWVVGVHGEFELSYLVDGVVVANKSISVKSLI